MITLIRSVNPTESKSDHTKQPGMKPTCARLPGRLVKMNTVA
jgi:hypothetical protein